MNYEHCSCKLLSTVITTGFSRRAGDRRFSPCTKAYHAGCKFWIHFIFGTTLNVSTIETKRFLLSARKCSENAGYAVFRGSMPPDPPRCSNFSPYFNFISSYYATLGRTLHKNCSYELCSDNEEYSNYNLGSDHEDCSSNLD